VIEKTRQAGARLLLRSGHEYKRRERNLEMDRIQRGAESAIRSLLSRPPDLSSAAEIRARVLEAALAATISVTGHRGLNALEIGTMFGNDEGLSTFRIARALSGGTFVSIDVDPQAIASCKAILARHDPALVDRVTFIEGESLDMLPAVLADMAPIDFVLIDGVAEPEPNFGEFQLVLPSLADHGLLLIDDAQDVPPDPRYGGPRPYGKASLIFPFLVLAEHWRYRRAYLPDHEPPQMLTQVASLSLIRTLAQYDWHLISERHHRMLVLAQPATMAEFMIRLPKTLPVEPVATRPR